MEYRELTWDTDAAAREKFIAQLAPVVIFTYNRLDHTRRTIEALRENIYAESTDVYIYSDSPKKPKAAASVAIVREYLHTVTGFKSVHIIEREENYGLARNIIDGVTRAADVYGRVIVVEDDIVTSKYFLKYMNDALTVYADTEKVMAVSGFCEIEDRAAFQDEVFFLPWFSCWGWATWARSWRYFHRDPEELYRYCTTHDMTVFNRYGAQPDAFGQVERNYTGALYTWAIFFYAAIIRHGGLVAYPAVNLAHNVGNDGTGENCGDVDPFAYVLGTQAESKFPSEPQLVKAIVAAEVCALKRLTSRSLLMRVTSLYKRGGITAVVRKTLQKLTGR